MLEEILKFCNSEFSMKKTKIVCTLGPACRNEKTLTEMALAGMNVARLNFSHGADHDGHKRARTSHQDI